MSRPVSGGRRPRLLVGACGSSALVNLPAYLVALRSTLSAEVTVVMTWHAQRFLPPRTLELFCDAVVTPAEGDAFDRNHVELAQWADTCLVLPATTHVLARVAQGDGDSMLTSTLLAHGGSVLFHPAMNATLWNNSAVQRNVAMLRADGHVVADPVFGRHYVAASKSVELTGGLAAPASVVAAVAQSLEPVVAEAGAGVRAVSAQRREC